MKTISRLFSLVFVTLTVSLPAFAGSLPYNIGTVEDYLNNSTYFNGFTELNAIDFSGQWQYTAIAYESGNINIASINEASTTNGTPDSTTFSTADASNFGTWKNIDFSTEQLYFEDSNGPYNVKLDPISNDNYFRVFQLTAASNPLDYLDGNLTLALGTIIVGFNDNGLSGGDSDYDDIIVALQPVNPVPIPAALLMFAPALLGFFGFRRKMQA